MTDARHPPSLDPVAAGRWARQGVSSSPWLHEEIASRMQQRLDVIRLRPSAWLDWEPMRGGLQGHQALQQRYPDAARWLWCEHPVEAQAVRKRLQSPWWQPSRWRGGPCQLGLPGPGQVQMVWANMALHHSADPTALIRQWHQVLATDGFLMMSCLGPDTLRELRGLYHQQGWGEPAHEFTDMHDWGDMLVQAGFAEPVMDMERISLTYASPERLLQELRELGRNLHHARGPGLRGRGWRQRLLKALQSLARPDQDGRLTLTFEVIYGHAIKPQPRAKVQAHSEIAVDDLRQMLRSGRGHGRKL